MIGPYLTDTVTQKQYKGMADNFGTPSARTSVSLRSSIEYKNENVTDFAGITVVSRARITIRPLTVIRDNFSTRAENTIAYEDLIVFDGKDHVIADIKKNKDFSVRSFTLWVR